MKRIYNFAFFILTLFVAFSCSSSQLTSSKQDVLLDKKGWIINELDEGLVHYEFPSQYMQEFSSFQNVHVLSIDLKKANYSLEFFNRNKSDSVSSIAQQIPNVIAAVNGTYYEKSGNQGKSTSYLKYKKELIDSVEVGTQSLFSWKHEGAFYLNGNQAGIVRGNNEIYHQLEAENIMSGSPLLIENYHPSGTHFVRNYVENLNDLHYENPDRHQGVRHPRTAVAILPNDIVLLVTVDGRNDKSAGMSAKELTLFLIKYFNPQDALNMDGGGSTTIWLEGEQRSKTGVINYPTDNKKWDHYGQRRIRNGFIILKK